MSDDHEDRSLPATPARRQQAAQEGRLARSRAATAGAATLGGAGALLLWGPAAGERMTNAARRAWGETLAPDAFSRDPAAIVSEALTFVGVELFMVAGPIVLITALVAIIAEAAQVGLLWLPDRLSLDFTRLDPVAGWSRIVSLDSVRRMASGLLGLSLVGAFFAYRVWSELPAWSALSAGGAEGLLTLTGERWPWLLVEGAAVLLAWGAADYAVERIIHEQRLNMTPAELKQELREAVGDPTVLAARKRRRRGPPPQEAGADSDARVVNGRSSAAESVLPSASK